jgi:subtilisin-like proprotein convertase family protein
VKTLNVIYTEPGTGCQSNTQAIFSNSSPVIPKIKGPVQVCTDSGILEYKTEHGQQDYDWTISAGGTIISNNDSIVTVHWTGTGSQSIMVNYTNEDNCNAPSPTIYPVTVTPLPLAGFSYSPNPYCNNGSNPSPLMMAGAKKGSFTAPVGLSIDANTGVVNLSASTPGTYTVTNTISATGGCGNVLYEAQITITQLPAANITYSGSPFCTADGTMKDVSFSGTSGTYLNGIFNAAAGLKIDPGSGSIDPSASIKGSYIVTYTIPATDGCPVVVVNTATPVIITELPTIMLSYTSDAYCISDNIVKSPSLQGSTGSVSGGNYTASPSGLNIDAMTGRFTPSGSMAGTYTITYTTPASGGCGEVSKETIVTITEVPSALIKYPSSPLCKNETAVMVVMEGNAAFSNGVFSSNPAGLSIDPASGTINPSLSIEGNYTVKYTIPSSGGCAQVPVTTTVFITEVPTVNAGGDLVTCADGLALDVTGGANASFFNAIEWTTSGDGIFSDPSSFTNNHYTPGVGDKLNGTVTLTMTATGKDNCASVSDTKVIQINALPAPVVIVPANPEFCEGTIQPLTSVKNAVTNGNPVFSSGTINMTIPDNNFTGIKNKITVSGIPSNAVINNISVKFNVNHPSGKELIGNLRSPANKEINLFYMVGSGSNFTNTVISSSASNPIQTFGSSPFTGTFSPQATLGAMGAAFSTSFSQLYTTAASLNGDWYLKMSDMVLLAGNTGTLTDWSITINYSVPVEAVPVIWSPLTDLYIDVNAETPYSGQPLATVYTKVSQFGTTTYTATNVPDGGTGCTNSSTVDVIVRESPVVQIATDYCSDPGRVILTASATGGAPFTYKWNTGGSGESVHIDEARDYYVSATNSKGCVGTAVMAIAKELVINGGFEQGYIPGSFVTDYSYVAPPGNQNSLVSEGRFAIDSNANNYHFNFYGKDHSTPEQKGKFLIVNGYPGSSNKVIWEQTVAVEPNTRYYYSAWAMNLNNVAPFARLQFSVNGVQMGSIAELKNAPTPKNSNEVNVNNWVRFYYGLSDGSDQSWYSGSATTATIRIINLEPAVGGNDFGLDDISFATLSPFIRGPLADGSNQQLEICSGTPINPIIYQMGSGVENPTITGLPPGWEPTYDGLNYIISGTPVNNTNSPIRYDYILTIKGCNPVDQPKIMEGTLIVYPNSTLKMTSLPESKDQSLCINLPMNAITFNASGQLSSIKYSGLPVGTNLYHNTGNGQVIISGIPSLAGEFNYQVRTEGGICTQDTIKGVIKISPESVAGTVSSPTVCVGESGTVTLNETNQIGEVVTWQISNDGSSFTDIPNSANTTSQVFTNVNQSAYYRVKVKNKFCPQTAISLPGKIRISNLWEGGVDTIWSKPPNWSAGNLPNNACSNTITIPKVPVNKHNPWINAIVGNAQVTNLTILSGGHLTINEGNLQIKGNIINNGILDAKKGGVEYNGSANQSISSGIFLNNAIGDLKVNNSNKGVTLNAPVDIYRSLTFGSGSQSLITKDQLTLKSTKEETAWLGNMTGKTIIGTATVERYINTGSSAAGGHKKSWQLLATPTQGQSIKNSWQEGAVSTGSTPIKNPNPGYGTLLTTGYNSVPSNGFDLYTAPGPSIKTFNSNTGDYDKGPASTDLPIYNPNGYMILVRGDRTVFTSNGAETPTILRTKGTFITGDQTVSIPANSFASVGNPYASAIEIDKIVKSPGMTEFIAVWDPLLGGNYGLGGFVTLTKSGSGYTGVPSGGYYSGVTNFIQSGQAFMVQTKPGQSGTITFTEGSKVSGSKLVSRKGNEDSRTAQLRTNLFGLNADGSEFITDGTLHQFGPEYSNEIDGLDARKMTNTSENLAIFTNGKQIVIERRQLLNETDTLFFNLTGVRVQKYRLEFTAQNIQDGNLQGFIEDLYLGTKTILNLEGITKYDFEIENKPGSYASDRFRIVFKSALAPLPVTFVEINADQVKEGILVTWNVENEINILGYDIEKSIDGVSFTKMVHLSSLDNNSYNWLDKDVQSGNHYYRVKAVNENGKTQLSSIAKVYIQMEPSRIAVYPNPITNGIVNIHLINQPSGKYKIRLLNPVGQTIVNKTVTHSQGNSIHPIDWDYKMARGIYQIEITKPGGGVNLIKVVY